VLAGYKEIGVMDLIREYLPFLIPLFLVEVSLTVAAILHILKHPHYRFGTRVLWIILAFVQIIGPVIYFAFGKGED
jgi:hypothetical protein